eukprot:7270340-Prymnesium_polylepis.1
METKNASLQVFGSVDRGEVCTRQGDEDLLGDTALHDDGMISGIDHLGKRTYQKKKKLPDCGHTLAISSSSSSSSSLVPSAVNRAVAVARDRVLKEG